MRGNLFSLGTLINRFWRPRLIVLPWLASAAALILCACWDLLARGAAIDFVLIGLACYELVIGLTETRPDVPEVVHRHAPRHATLVQD